MKSSHIFLLFFSILLAGCISKNTDERQVKEEIITRQIVGSAEYPDPILNKVYELEKKGILSNVLVMESFPVQIRITGPQEIIKELEELPRIKIKGMK